MKLYNEKAGRTIDCDPEQMETFLGKEDTPWTREKPKSFKEKEKQAAQNLTTDGGGLSKSNVEGIVEEMFSKVIPDFMESVKAQVEESIAKAIGEIPEVDSVSGEDIDKAIRSQADKTEQVLSEAMDTTAKNFLDSDATEKLIRKLVSKDSFKK